MSAVPLIATELVTHYACGARDLVTDPIEHASLYSRYRRSLPVEIGGVYYGAFTEVCV